jgi:hypothetical protein
VLHLEHSFVWWGNLDSSETRSEVPGKFWNVKISWTDRVNNEAVLHRVKEERNILHTIRRRKTKWTGHILRRNCLLKYIIEGKIRGTRRRGWRRKQTTTWEWPCAANPTNYRVDRSQYLVFHSGNIVFLFTLRHK